MIDDVAAFRAAWYAVQAVDADERPNARILGALDRLAAGVVSRVAHGSTVEAALKPFSAAIKRGDGSVSSPSSIDVTTFRDGDRWLVDVRMGYASSVTAFDRVGKRLSLPPALRWSYRQFGPFFRTGRLVAFDGTSLSDAGVRYAYALSFLRRTPQGYVSAGSATGFSNYDFDEASSPRLVARDGRVTVMSLDAPRAFFVSNAESLLRRAETWDTTGLIARRTATRLLDPDVRAVDAWLWAHRGRPLIGKRRVPTEPTMVNEIRRGKGWVRLALDDITLRFQLVLRGGKNVVTGVTVEP